MVVIQPDTEELLRCNQPETRRDGVDPSLRSAGLQSDAMSQKKKKKKEGGGRGREGEGRRKRSSLALQPSWAPVKTEENSSSD